MAWPKSVTVACAAAALLASGACHAQPPTADSGCRAMSRRGLLAESAGGRIPVAGEVVRIPLVAACGRSIASRAGAADGRRVILLLDDLRAARRGGGAYAVTLAVDGHASGERPLGSFSFFGVGRLGAAGAQRAFSLDVTEPVRGFAAASGPPPERLSVVLTPTTVPPRGADLSIGRVQLVEQ